jgi:hypothetical protein
MHVFAQRCVNRMFERLLPKGAADALIGDLLEERAARCRAQGPYRSAGWYWAEVARSIAPALYVAFRHGDWVGAWAVGFVPYSVAVSAETSARASVARVATHTAVDAIPVLIVHLGALALGGYVAERVRAGASSALALLVGLSAALHLVGAASGMPIWYRVALLVAGPATALASGASAARRARTASGFERRSNVG